MNDDVPHRIPPVEPTPPAAKGPVEAKVVAATGGSAVGVAIAGFILWLLDTYVFTTDPVPDAVSVLVWAIVPIGLTFASGYSAKHTFRNDAQAQASRQ